MVRDDESRGRVVGVRFPPVDRVDTDLAAAAAAGLDSALVLSGGARRKDAEGLDPAPVAVAETLAALLVGS